MGKAQKLKVSKKNTVTTVGPLGDQLQTTAYATPTGRVKDRNRLDEDEDFVESRLSKNILSQARIQVIKLQLLQIMSWLSQRCMIDIDIYHRVTAMTEQYLSVSSWSPPRTGAWPGGGAGPGHRVVLWLVPVCLVRSDTNKLLYPLYCFYL